MSEFLLKLPQQLDMGALPGLKEELLGALASSGRIVVEGGEVERIGTPAVQLLLAASKEFSAGGRGFALRAPSEVLLRAFDELGLGAEARQWSAA